ncbi:hypothetical protein CQW23_12400 [Capsicum baccatum]|uniref:Uncharacterized protein n=1 Tax=Capsicum baccatum TaxID=33114 RepID=A0A2G2WSL8_CAPBA|nr:hypothetical protein CQW23_12400 [Capsicum baccatum]
MHLKFSKIKRVMAIKDTSLDKFDYGFASEFPMASVIIVLQSGCFTKAKRRKSSSVQRFAKDITSDVVNDTQDVVPNGTSGHLVEFILEEFLHHGFIGNGLGDNNMCDNS